MKKVLFINASPRKKGNTSTLIRLIKQKLDINRFQIDTVSLYDETIGACIDCRKCKENNLECVLKDDMKSIYERIDVADFIIFGTPIYWYGPTAKMKLLLDRFRPYFVNKKLEDKQAVMLFTAGMGEEDCDLSFEMYNRMINALGMNNLKTIRAKAYDEGEVLEDDNAMYGIEKLIELMNFSLN